MKILGVDCEGVIFRAYGNSIQGSFESLRKIQKSGLFERIYIISRVGLIGRIYFPFRLWLMNFSERTGIPWKNIYFCRRQEEKAIICKRLGVTDFVDDKFKVLRHMKNLERRYAFNSKAEDIENYSKGNENVIVVGSWAELLPMLLS
jgi:hypothetical protein